MATDPSTVDLPRICVVTAAPEGFSSLLKNCRCAAR
jgi:hypothetical protein